MEDNDKEEMASLIADKLTEYKKEKSWFSRLNLVSKVLIFIVTFGGTVSSLGVGIDYADSIINHEEIARKKAYRIRVDKMVVDLSSLIKSVDTLKAQGEERKKVYAVGYRAKVLKNGEIIKMYRGWDKVDHLIYPDPFSSTTRFIDWFFTKQDGTKEYTFGK